MKDQTFPCWVSAYSVSRHYGGPEEGGWWYDWRTLESSIRVNNAEQLERAKSLLSEVWCPGAKTRHSVLGGTDAEVRIEDVSGEFASTERPYYD